MNIYVLPKGIDTTIEIKELDEENIFNLIATLNELDNEEDVLIKISEDDVQRLAHNEQFVEGHIQLLKIYGVDYPPAFDIGNNWSVVTQDTMEAVEKSTKEKKKRDKAKASKTKDIPEKSTSALISDVFQKGKLEDVEIPETQDTVIIEED